jgi:heme-degrading monooxygenase HmoA
MIVSAGELIVLTQHPRQLTRDLKREKLDVETNRCAYKDNLYGGDIMFVVLISFPPIKAGRDAEFREWFVSSNEEFSKFKGFIRRRLLKPSREANYAAIVEFENQDAFKAMHSSPAHDMEGEHVKPLFDGYPTPHFYQVVIG